MAALHNSLELLCEPRSFAFQRLNLSRQLALRLTAAACSSRSSSRKLATHQTCDAVATKDSVASLKSALGDARSFQAVSSSSNWFIFRRASGTFASSCANSDISALHSMADLMFALASKVRAS
jgi:hypothetical protein